MTGMSRKIWKWPRSRVIPSPLPNNPSTAVAPSATITAGRTKSICSSNHGRHVFISSGVGLRLPEVFPGVSGRHFKMLAI